MKRKKVFLGWLGVLFLLLITTLLYAGLRDNDPYRYYTGLGENISIAPDDSEIAFSYYVDGKKSIYKANLDGSKVEEVTDENDRKNHHPKYARNGNQLVYLSEDQDGIQTLWRVNEDGSGWKQLTNRDLYVKEAISLDEKDAIYFVAMEAEEWKKGEESQEGFDLYTINPQGEVRELTEGDYFAMDSLFVSPDGEDIYFSEFDGGKERIYSYSVDEEVVNETPSLLPEEEHDHSFYNPQLSPDGKYLAYTEVTEESEESSLFEYELFLLDTEKGGSEQLTNFKKAVTSPEFFHTENKMAFMENTNWPGSPAVHEIRTIDLTTKEIESIELDAPESSVGYQLLQMMDRAVNIYTIASVYVLFLGLLSVYLHYYHSSKAYLPSIVSFSLAVAIFIFSILAVAIIGMNPWYGIGLAMLAAGIFICSVIVVLFLWFYRRWARGK